MSGHYIQMVASREGWPLRGVPLSQYSFACTHNHACVYRESIITLFYLITGLLPNFRHSNYRTIIMPCEVSNAILHALLILMLRYLHFVQ